MTTNGERVFGNYWLGDMSFLDKLTLSYLVLSILLLAQNNSLVELCPNPASRNRHYNGLHCTYFIIGQTLFFGHAKVMLHSRIAGESHGRGQVKH